MDGLVKIRWPKKDQRTPEITLKFHCLTYFLNGSCLDSIRIHYKKSVVDTGSFIAII
jgi:hypothetical protein